MERVAVIGLDIGLRRVGVAGCDGLGLIATELTTVNRRSFKEDVEAFRRIIEEREANLLVAGIPYTMKGEIGFQAKQVIKYAKRLSNALELPLEFVDERLTSLEAEEQLKSSKKYSSRQKGLIDKRAAAIILQQWLDIRRSQSN
ncbi:Holliday junction resolvase RuvX [Cyanobacterium aponinum UTEX 3222]|uniref:Putative pre-16S rRNA nuclease n=3 Tax=Cyanobacterium aponinum TaxID=379064 RepID=K9Z9F0_CYAAP|nr:Holliday junction resolvase RuvX [Cyanobacterium aponinum]WRL42995.1 Holliday junction resolvase RuvX [Cyanobacterium aponinum UTEX 3222]AFZ55018.1 Holliday junction resolvase [Cyanobacterium aponinum PCC 10605]MBD2394238.1 Holliday junction resolvase RuvX [Cyanobacterium aponinum FACHB-4101]MTF39977.1 Holliday junction resolvase RuvX [Cyanobacterium aponinum 0216]PHV62476.1 Holliday junction resolvase RuvX [Cyanobacterium aponinum IPPAS B-1201]